MTDRRSTAVAAVVSVVLLVLAAGVIHARDRASTFDERDLPAPYVPPAAMVSRVVLSFDAVAADVYWVRAILHDGQERQANRSDPRFPLLEPLVNVAVSLDPQFNIAYRIGAILMALEPPLGPGRADRAIALLERGLHENPDRWQYAHDIGYIHYFHTGRFDEAARWFERAAAIPGSPSWLAPLAAATMAQGGNRQGARQLLGHLVTSDDEYLRRSAERSLAQLQALDEMDALTSVARQVHARTGAYPASLEALIAGTSLPSTDPAGRRYGYEPSRGMVSIAADSPLAPLPRVLAPLEPR